MVLQVGGEEGWYNKSSCSVLSLQLDSLIAEGYYLKNSTIVKDVCYGHLLKSQFYIRGLIFKSTIWMPAGKRMTKWQSVYINFVKIWRKSKIKLPITNIYYIFGPSFNIE